MSVVTTIDCPDCEASVEVRTNDLSHVNECGDCGAVFWYDPREGVIR